MKDSGRDGRAPTLGPQPHKHNALSPSMVGKEHGGATKTSDGLLV